MRTTTLLPRCARRPTARGFTLIEVLVALVILSVMAAMAWQGVDGMLRSREIAQGHLAATLRVQTVIAQFEADVREVVDTQTLPGAVEFDGASLRLTRRAPGGVQLVVWSLKGTTWQRWAAPVVTNATDLREAWMRSQQLMGNEAGQVRALEGVSQWQVYAFHGNAWSNAQSTGNVTSAFMSGVARTAGPSNPPIQLRQTAPLGVRIVLTLEPASGLAGTVTRQVLVAPQMAS